MADYDPRLVQLYDSDNPDGADSDFFRSLADDLDARKVVDLGCGTGLLTVTFSTAGRDVVGIDPSPAMLGAARARRGAENVSWVLGDSRDIGDAQADLVVMSGNVAQHITGKAWHQALRDIRNGLLPGGTLAFERRNPLARAWEQWTRENTYGTRNTAIGELVEWYEVTSVDRRGDVSFTSHNLLTASGGEKPEAITEHLTLSFLGREEVSADLEASGFHLTGIWSGWHREPMEAESPLMVFEARRQ
ncbi:class I SAM-dependent methyltransferase [Arthrobacter sp. Br18]|uniref:class I SAM-dependent methyltransferase n=1 Tax=Arthrobacter sp. Br18 TaxID=1312954 RepID=UPI00047AB6A5|nr:class I SAM-dependent methyltransferase [Arthrobacter sp. Br18]